jgi:cytochrome c oxidase cbb3-type subunit III
MHTRVPGGYPNDIPAERLATGNAEAGKAYFEKNCASCHSVAGDLKGVASKLTPPDLQTHFLYPYGKLPTATVTLASGKQFSGTMLLKDDFNVAIQGVDGWYHSWPLGAVKVEVKDPLAAHANLLRTWTNADMHNMFTYLETLK